MAVIILAISQSGMPVARKLAEQLNAPLHGRVDRTKGADVTFANALDHTRDLFAAGHSVVGICASGILIRAVAPMLNNKTQEPPLISVSDDGRAVVPLLGGHQGANRLAKEIAAILEADAAVTTAGDIALGLALDEPPLGWKLVNRLDAKPVMAALLSGARAKIVGEASNEATWLSALPTGDDLTLHCTTKKVDTLGEGQLQFAPQKVTIGVGCSRNCPIEELADLVQKQIAAAGITPEAIHSINTIDLKADEPAILALARHLNVPLRFFSARELDAQTARIASPSKVVYEEVGTHSVSEAAALSQSDESSLLVAKKKTKHATAAIAIAPTPLANFRGGARGRLSIIGIGPGQASWRTPEASKLIQEAEELVGYGLYIDLLGPSAAGKTRSDFPLGGEEDRCRYALEEAAKGKNVALICSGDAGIYAMGALVFELMDRDSAEMGVSQAAKRVEVICTPGISALQAAAARAGAPLGHDFCAISLSDLLTPRDDIIRRIKAAAMGDFVIAFYNPVSKKRRTLLAKAREILLEHRPAETPVMLASSLGRPEEHIRYRSLDALEVDEVDMLTVVLIGSSNSRLAALGDGPRMYTPRGYARKIDGDLS